MQRIGVVGAGIMGKGITQTLAESGFGVDLYDCDEAVLSSAVPEIARTINMQNLFSKQKDRAVATEVCARISTAEGLTVFQSHQIVIESITEDMQAKQALYKQMDAICGESSIFLSNTSCISITKLGSYTRRPDKVIGTHFMNPVGPSEAVEVIMGYHTAAKTREKVEELLSAMQKQSIIVQDFPGFISNRISHLMMNEAAFLIQDGVARPKDVDDIFKKCYRHRMGPLETADLIGLDTVVRSLDVLYESYQDSKFRCCPLLRKMVDAGDLGRKSKKGFYQY